MRYYLDTEFIEQQGSIDLISIGIVAEDGRTYYAESTSYDIRKASDWVKENVYPNLRWMYSETGVYKNKGFNNSGTNEGQTEVYGELWLIESTIKEFIGDDTPEFWGYYCDYDWVVFCWIFGAMIDLPDKWPMFCRDIKQEMYDHENIEDYSPFEGRPHNSLDDAIQISKTVRMLVEE